MIWAIVIYLLVSLVRPGTQHQTFHHWPPVVAIMAGGTAVVYFTARTMAGRAAEKLNRNTADAGRIRARLALRLMLLQSAVLGGFYYSVRHLGFGRLLQYHALPRDVQWPVPYIYAAVLFVSFFLIQLGVYRFATAWRQFRDAERLATGKHIYPWPGARQFALDMVRTTAGLTVALLVFAAILNWCQWFALLRLPSTYELNWHVASIMYLLLIPVLWVVYPYVLVRVMKTTPLADGPLRRHLLSVAKRYRIRITDICVIQTHHRIANAAWIGTIFPPRYILLTDLIVDDFTPDQVEDVFAHELGHGHHRHATWYLLLMLTFILGIRVLGRSAADSGRLDAWLSMFMPLIIFAVVLMFGKFSRLSEFQADWFAARHWAGRSGNSPCSSATSSGPVGIEREAVVSGAALGAEALRNLADQNMLRTDRTFLTHPSIEDRIAHLYSLSYSPHLERRMHLRARRWRWFIGISLAATFISLVYLSLHR